MSVVEKPDDAACHIPWLRMMISTGGTVHVCCYNVRPLGHVPPQTFEEVWEGDEFNALRKSIVDQTFDRGCTDSCPIVSSRGILKSSISSSGLHYERR
ncbi:MAG: SPASM domain-containing protein [Proteobacteria bacterium]|nr:SPASM domain-containing protein [Pseudomonadota bacterium]